MVLVVATIITLASLNLSRVWLCYNETRPGRLLSDPLLALFAPIDLSNYIFLITNVALTVGFFLAMWLPFYMLRTMFCITMLAALRMMTMYLFPLEAPLNIIPLRDPFLELFFYGDAVIMKDLFYSGHTANLFLLFLIIPYKKLRWIMLATTITVGCMLLIQHVHYTIDVIAAPIFTYIAYYVSNKLAHHFYGNHPIDFTINP